MELMEAIHNRRSVRRFTDYTVSDDELREMLEAARYAPSWANTQSWRFVVIRDKNIIKEITETYSDTNPARKCSFSATALIAACADTKLVRHRGEEERIKFLQWFMFDLGMAVQNLCLRAHELGLGTVVVGSLDHEKCNNILSVPEGMDAVAMIPVGKPEPRDAPKPAPKRKELQEFVWLNTFHEQFKQPE